MIHAPTDSSLLWDSVRVLIHLLQQAGCTWKGWVHFQVYVWSSIVAHNLALFGRLRAP